MATNTWGTTLTLDGTAVAKVVSMQGPGIESPKIDVTHLNTSAFAREYIADFAEPGEYTFEIINVKATFQSLWNKQLAGTSHTFVVTWPGSQGSFTFTGQVGKVDPKTEVGDAIRSSCKIIVSGAPTFA